MSSVLLKSRIDSSAKAASHLDADVNIHVDMLYIYEKIEDVWQTDQWVIMIDDERGIPCEAFLAITDKYGNHIWSPGWDTKSTQHRMAFNHPKGQPWGTRSSKGAFNPVPADTDTGRKRERPK